jgi:hypothetical protein
VVSTAKPLTYAGRCRRYLAQRGIAYDPHRMSIHRLTHPQRRRALRKERRSWAVYARDGVYDWATGYDEEG